MIKTETFLKSYRRRQIDNKGQEAGSLKLLVFG